MAVITESKPWKCLVCKRPAADSEATCAGCGHRLRADPRPVEGKTNIR